MSKKHIPLLIKRTNPLPATGAVKEIKGVVKKIPVQPVQPIQSIVKKEQPTNPATASVAETVPPEPVTLTVAETVAETVLPETVSTVTETVAPTAPPEPTEAQIQDQKKKECTIVNEVGGITIIRRQHTKMDFSTGPVNCSIARPEDDIQPNKYADKYVSLSTDEKEDLIEKLETRKYKLGLGLSQSPPPPNARELEKELEETLRLLSLVKECDADDKVKHNKSNKAQIEREFRQNKKQLPASDFNRIVDLTAPKEDREPDITTQICFSSREICKDKRYRSAGQEKEHKFEKKMQQLVKPMPKDIMDRLKRKTNDNIAKINIHRHNPTILSYGKYDPSNFKGLYSY